MSAKLLLVALMMTPSTALTDVDDSNAAAGADVAWEKSPLKKVVDMLLSVHKQVDKEGNEEQKAYDKYACWVEDTLKAKSTDISDAEKLIGELNDQIVSLSASTATLKAEIKALDKDISDNIASTNDAEAVRKKEHSAFAEAKVDSEQSISSLKKAIQTLTGAGTFLESKATGYKQQLKEAELLSVATSVRRVMETSQAQSKLSEEQIQAVSRFVQNPQDVSSSQGMIAAQIGQNPMGDYAPASSQIQGILKSMLDSMTADLADDIKEEAASKKSFDALMKEKRSELDTLKSGLQAKTSTSGKQTKLLADRDILRDNTKDQLEKDQEFFKDTEEAAEEKATEWATRQRLRVEELAGLQGAADTLKEGGKTFAEAEKTFLQIKSVTEHKQRRHEETLNHLKTLAAKYQSSSLTKVSEELKSTGHFDSVIASVDKMMVELREEEQDDIEHRDRCQSKENANTNDISDTTADITKATKALKRMKNTDTQLSSAVVAAEDKIKAATRKMAELTALRNKDNANFKQALKVDGEAVSVVAMATGILTKMYAKQNVNTGLLQAKQEGKPQYSKDNTKPPKTEFNNAGEHQGQATNIVAILNMMKEDFEKEMAEGKADEKKAQAEYEKQKAAFQATIDAQAETKVSLENEKDSLAGDMADEKSLKTGEESDLDALKKTKKAIKADCSWVAKKFDSRRKKRKAEMDGLVDAKDFLSGVSEGRAVIAR